MVVILVDMKVRSSYSTLSIFPPFIRTDVSTESNDFVYLFGEIIFCSS